MKKFKPESQYMRKGVMLLFGIVTILVIFSGWYFLGHAYRISDEVFHASALGKIPRWIPWTTLFTASFIFGRAYKMNNEDKKKNKFVRRFEFTNHLKG